MITKKNWILVVILLFPFTLFSCSKNKEDAEIPEGANASFLPAHIKDNYKLVWNDEFDGTTINPAKWNFRGEGTVRNYATVSRNTISMDGKGHVSIKVTKDAAGKYYVGQLGTQGIFEPMYGYFECSAMVNRSLGPHVAFWLQSPTFGKTQNPASDGAEIDIFEYHRKEPGIVHHNIHWDGYGDTHKQTGKKYAYPSVGEGYHSFGLEWTKDEYIFYVDGKETWRTSAAVSQRGEYLILSTELTGWGGDPAQGNFPDEVIFDYVRVFQKK